MPSRLRLPALLAAAAAAAVAVTGCGSSGGDDAASTPMTTTEHHAGGAESASAEILFPPAPAPALGVKDHLGRTVTTRQFRGKALFVTFVYARCPDVCPLIVANFRRTLDRLGPARAAKVAIVAVSVDPEGDTPAIVSGYLKRMRMTGRMQWLVGGRAELERLWLRWGVATRVPKDNPELVEHAAPIYGVDASGTITTIYDSSFRAGDLVADFGRLTQGS
ncbi:MAG: SCO family protein [Actinomycetota bacterium]